jgi:hypothetical protein
MVPFIHEEDLELFQVQMQPFDNAIERKYEELPKVNPHELYRGFQVRLRIRDGSFIRINIVGRIEKRENFECTFVGIVNCFKCATLAKPLAKEFVTKLDKNGFIKTVDIG